MKTGLVWFKNDLRLHDNKAVCRAIADCDQVVYCYCVEQSLFHELDLGFRKADITRFKFLEQSVNSLQRKVENLGGHLVIGSNTALEFIPKMIEKFDITVVYGECEYAAEELKLIDTVKTRIPGVNFEFFWGKTLYHIDDIPFTIDKIPLTSKAYRIPASKESSPREPFEIPNNLLPHPKAKSSEFPSHRKYGFSDQGYHDATPFLSGGEDAGLKRLQYYTFETQFLTDYRWTRNKSLGLDYSSKFSPYLALGCLSPREIYSAIKQYEQHIKKNQSTWWLVFELVWRDYFTFKGMRMGDKTFKTEGFKTQKIEFENNYEYFKRWCDGQTGIPFVDAHMRQLNVTGYMSNRGRVNCSSYLVHDLKIDWTWGAAYFESKLIDYDVSSNWLNWHVQAYEIYYTNPVNQSNKYHAQKFIRKWVPELTSCNDVEVLIPWEYSVPDYPEPIALCKKWTRSINKIKSIVNKAEVAP